MPELSKTDQLDGITIFADVAVDKQTTNSRISRNSQKIMDTVLEQASTGEGIFPLKHNHK